MRTAVNILALNLGWFACVLAAARGTPWLGPLVVAGLIAVHLALSPVTERGRELRRCLVIGVAGLLLDSALFAAGLLRFESSVLPRPFAPLWIGALWANFATGLTVALAWLQGRHLLAAIFGAIGGPLAYFGGANLGGLDLHAQLWPSFLAIGLVWAVATPVMAGLAARSSSPIEKHPKPAVTG